MCIYVVFIKYLLLCCISTVCLYWDIRYKIKFIRTGVHFRLTKIRTFNIVCKLGSILLEALWGRFSRVLVNSNSKQCRNSPRKIPTCERHLCLRFDTELSFLTVQGVVVLDSGLTPPPPSQPMKYKLLIWIKRFRYKNTRTRNNLKVNDFPIYM